MIKHIVLFKFKEEEKYSFMIEAKRELEKLVDKIDELKSMEIGINNLDDDTMPDFSLTSTFDDNDGLEVYRTHPEHLKVVDLIKPMAIGRWVVDYHV